MHHKEVQFFMSLGQKSIQYNNYYVDIGAQITLNNQFCYSGSHKMKGTTLTLFTVAMRTRPVFHNAPDVL